MFRKLSGASHGAAPSLSSHGVAFLGLTSFSASFPLFPFYSSCLSLAASSSFTPWRGPGARPERGSPGEPDDSQEAPVSVAGWERGGA